MASSTFRQITKEEILALGTYDVERVQELPDINATGFILRHKKTGARVALLPCDDSNKVFYIGFRTPPKDSTGVAHIIEHTVLCGSRDFPVKDPFLEAVKGSLNTFLNAMTYPDKTVYPVASTNEKDFDNLVHIYLDAVFHPNIYTEQNIFRQEGWHYEAVPHTPGGEDIDEDSDITVNGVVYNEMKGVMSSPDDVLGDKVLASLYPDTTYAIVSGGDPEVIPDLTYEHYLDFHRKYYHPSNSYIYFYGDMDMAQRLKWLDEMYLSQYDHLDVDSEIHTQEPFDKTRYLSYPYAAMEGEDTAGKTYLSCNFSIPVADEKENLAFKVLDYTLCDAEGAPVKEALRKKNIGQSVESLYESGIRQPYYSIMSKYADASDEEAFVSTIHDTLEDLVENGIDPRALEAGIGYYEFHYREADFGSYPKGLIFGLDALDHWLYDDTAAFISLDDGKYFDALKEDIGTGYFEKLIRRFLLDNPHRSVVSLVPEPGLQSRQDEKLRAKMAAFKESLTREERRKILDETKALKEWQQTPDTKEHLDTIPVLSRSDLGKRAVRFRNELIDLQGNALEKEQKPCVLAHHVFTSGIDYVTFMFDISKIPARLFPYVAVFKTLLGALDTEKYGYAELDQEITIKTGGIIPSVNVFNNVKQDGDYRISFDINMKVMDRNLEDGCELVLELINGTKFEDMDRIIEVLEEEYAGLRAELPASGHATAAGRAAGYISATAKIGDELSGIDFYNTLKGILAKEKDTGDGTEAGTDFRKTMEELRAFIFRRDNLLIDITTSEKMIRSSIPTLSVFADELGEKENGRVEKWLAPDWDQQLYRPELSVKNEGFMTAGQVQFVACAGNFKSKGFPYTGALNVLRVIMGYDYLWKRIRMLGGAYGCMSSFGRSGNAFFVTYRDPHLLNSLKVFSEAADFVRTYEADERAMTKSVIGAISSIDRPMSPRQLGRYSQAAYLTGLTYEDVQREREQVLTCTVEDIRRLGDYVAAFVSDSCICIVGAQDKIKENSGIFDEVKELL